MALGAQITLAKRDAHDRHTYPRCVSAQVLAAGQPVTAANGGVNGGLIANPLTATDQGLQAAEPLYVDPAGPCLKTAAGGTIFALQPGQTWALIPGQTTPTIVNAASAGHKFTVTTW